MGVIKEYECPSCHKTWRFKLGHGMQHGILNNVKQYFSPDVQDAIDEKIEGKEFPWYEFNILVGQCSKCKSLQSVSKLKLECGDFTTVCIKCGEEIVMTDKINCPDCENAILNCTDVGYWD